MLIKNIVIFLFLSTAYTDEIFSKIINGQDINYENNQHLVNLNIYSYGYNKVFACSGSIISKRWIVTVAHCILYKEEYVEAVEVYHYMYVPGPMSTVKTSNVVPHPKYDPNNPNIAVDIALLKTSKKIVFYPYISAIKLAKMSPRIGVIAYISGYGATEDSNNNLFRPREGKVTIASCGKKGKLCTEHKPVEAGYGDSGGSLVSDGRLVGVTSAKCEDHTLYVDVAIKLEWIQRVTKLRIE